ncbi:unnamed protein product [marine sediment metagenome]|uniref:Uncharacterized protein n=1 Tax=marine sediment metagenome TaxID=412755 RepID=X0WGQ2_9ZZZZ
MKCPICGDLKAKRIKRIANHSRSKGWLLNCKTCGKVWPDGRKVDYTSQYL